MTRRVKSALAGVALAVALIAYEQYRLNQRRWAAAQSRDHRDHLRAQAGDA